MINVTKTFLPPFEEYTAELKKSWDKAWITNNGELVQELEAKLKEYLGVKHLFYTTNGTIVLQMALKAYNITKEVITTPFSYVATTNAILWEGCTPVFVDIDPATFCIDPNKIEEAITDKTEAILATHVYGLPCNIEAIEKIAQKHKLKVIYDAAHAFGTVYKGKSLLSYGDISTCSFHATKVFHTVEGGCIITNDDETARQLMLFRQFGHIGDEYFTMGVNAKNSEFHAAMGVVNLRYVYEILKSRKELSSYYTEKLTGFDYQAIDVNEETTSFNYSYYPIILKSEEHCNKVMSALKENDILPRRYFYPGLSNLPFVKKNNNTPVSDDIAPRVLCLPLYFDLAKEDIDRICKIVKSA